MEANGDMEGSSAIEVKIRQSIPGDAGYVAFMHGLYYWKHHGFLERSEYYFIKHLADFVHNPEGGMLWVADIDGATVGSIGIVRIDDGTAQLRWFMVDEGHQHKGIGSKLMETALSFCRENHYMHVFLWTFKGLDAARRLYDKTGFLLTEEVPNHEWSNVEILEQRLDLKL
jgi:GNAT superfamily N-acetyltransferase